MVAGIVCSYWTLQLLNCDPSSLWPCPVPWLWLYCVPLAPLPSYWLFSFLQICWLLLLFKVCGPCLSFLFLLFCWPVSLTYYHFFKQYPLGIYSSIPSLSSKCQPPSPPPPSSHSLINQYFQSHCRVLDTCPMLGLEQSTSQMWSLAPWSGEDTHSASKQTR